MTIDVTSPSQTSGPMWRFALLFEGSEHAVDPSDPDAIEIVGQISDGDGPFGSSPFPDPGLVEVWQEDQWARTSTDENGEYFVTVRKPKPFPAPDGRSCAPYLNLTLFARGLLKHVQTRMYFPDEQESNEADPVLELVPEQDRHTLIAKVEDDHLRFDVRLQGDDATVFFAV